MDVTEQQDTETQDLYAGWLDRLTKAAFCLSLAAFLLYVSGAVTPYLALERLPELWGLPLAEYLERSGVPTGWRWIDLVGYGDYLNLVPIALFALVVLLCYLRIIPLLLRPGSRLQGALAVAQILVLLAAASGLLSGGN